MMSRNDSPEPARSITIGGLAPILLACRTSASGLSAGIGFFFLYTVMVFIMPFLIDTFGKRSSKYVAIGFSALLGSLYASLIQFLFPFLQAENGFALALLAFVSPVMAIARSENGDAVRDTGWEMIGKALLMALGIAASSAAREFLATGAVNLRADAPLTADRIRSFAPFLRTPFGAFLLVGYSIAVAAWIVRKRKKDQA